DMRTRTVIAPALALLIAACGENPRPAPEENATQASTAAAATPATQPAVDTPAAAPAPTPQTGGSLRVDLPAEGAIGFTGFGPAKFGASAEEVRMAWGGDFEEPMAHEPGGCHYLIPKQPVKQGYKVAFMIEGERFVRIDV